MSLSDQHVHSRHSVDSKASPASCVARAIDRGLSGITFTEHFDTNPKDWADCVYHDEAIASTIEQLRSRFGSAIFIGKGIEVCFQPDRMDFILDFLDSHHFDLVMLSVHYFGTRPLHSRASWSGVDACAGTRRYLETVREAARFCASLHARRGRVFDVLGHLDLAKRYTQRFFDSYDVAPFSSLLDDILTACLMADLTPEINTSSLRQDLTETMPGATVVARYAALGGKAMSLGSDAHRAEDVGSDLNTAAAMLRAAAMPHMAIFRERQRTLVALQ